MISRSCSLCAIDLLRTAVPAIVRDIITIRLVRKAKVQNTRWVRDPNLALITWRKSVWASYLILSYLITWRKVLAPGARILSMMERMEKMMIWMVAPPAYQ